jgi:hypothetical protein
MYYVVKMGLFNKDPQEKAERRANWVRDKHQKAQELLLKRGFSLDGLIMLDDGAKDGAEEYLLIFPDRVEYVNHGKPSLTGKKGKGTEVIPISRISSVTTRKTSFITEHVQITTSGQVIDFHSSPWVASTLKQTILDLMLTNTNVNEKAEGPSQVKEQLLQLAELHQAGILTDDEFSNKKADLLKRI